ATNGRLAVVTRVAAEATLVHRALGRAVEGQAHVLEVDDRVDGLLGENLGGILDDEIVTTLDGVEGVPLPVVFLDVREGSSHAALRSTRVGSRRVELGDHGRAGLGPSLDGRTHPGAASADDNHVELVVVHAVLDGA